MTDLALRVQKSIRVSGRNYDTVAEHNRVFESHGKVAFAKFGAGLSDNVVSRLNFAATDSRTRLVIVYRADDDFYGFAADIAKVVQTSKQAATIAASVPEYYRTLIDEAHVDPPESYLVLSSAFKPVSLGKFSLASSGRSLLTVLHECRTSAMLINEPA